MADFRRGLTDYLERMLRAQERIAAEWEGYLPGVREAADRAEEREDKVGAWERLLLLSAVLTLFFSISRN